MLLALVGTFVCLMDLLESTGVLPFFGLEVGPLSFPLVDSLFLRIVLDVVTAGVMVRRSHSRVYDRDTLTRTFCLKSATQLQHTPQSPSPLGKRPSHLI